MAQRRAGTVLFVCARMYGADGQGAEEDARAALAAIQKPSTPYTDADKTTLTETTEQEMTYAANTTTATAISGKSGGKMVKKKSGKPKLTAKEKKERNVRLVVFCQVRGIDRVSFWTWIDTGGEDYLMFTT